MGNKIFPGKLFFGFIIINEGRNYWRVYVSCSVINLVFLFIYYFITCLLCLFILYLLFVIKLPFLLSFRMALHIWRWPMHLVTFTSDYITEAGRMFQVKAQISPCSRYLTIWMEANWLIFDTYEANIWQGSTLLVESQRNEGSIRCLYQTHSQVNFRAVPFFCSV